MLAGEKEGVYENWGERERERERESAIKLLMVVVRNMRHLHIEYI